MKKSTLRRLLMLCLCLTLVTGSLIGGTLAKYASSDSGTGTVTVATWAPTFTVNNTDLANSETFTVTSDKWHPGSTVTVPVKVVNNSDTVDAQAIVTITIAGEGKATNMTYTYDGATFTSGTAINAYAVTKGTEGVIKNLVLTWPFEGSTNNDNSFAGKSFTVTVSITLEQTTNDLTTSD